MRETTLRAMCDRCGTTTKASVGGSPSVCTQIAEKGWMTILVKPFGASDQHDDVYTYDLCNACRWEALSGLVPVGDEEEES